MTPPAKSRKGKKAWRKHIDATEVEEFIKQTTHQERRGPAVESLQDNQLFFVDKTADEEEAQAVVSGLGKRRKREAKPLRSQLIINEPHKTKPVLVQNAVRKVSKASTKAVKQESDKPLVQKRSRVPPPDPAILDIWSDDFKLPQPGTSGRPQQLQPSSATASDAAAGMHKKRAKHLDAPAAATGATAAAPAKIKAVEVDMAGCSFNPDPELHQDALAQLVAAEMKKVLKKELEPAAPPAVLDPSDGHDNDADELAQLQVDAPLTDDDENEIPLGEDDATPGSGKKLHSKKTKKDRNREQRRLEQERQLAARRQLKKLRHDIDHIKQLNSELKSEETQKELRRLRREVVKAEKAAAQPPRLGKHKFEAPSVQVLTTDELADGSLRRLKAFPMMALDRFKSLQKRGLIEPRKPLSLKEKRKRIEYEKGARTEKAIAAQQEICDMQKRNQQAKNQAAAS